MQIRLQDVLTGRWKIPPSVRSHPYSTDPPEFETVLNVDRLAGFQDRLVAAFQFVNSAIQAVDLGPADLARFAKVAGD